MQPRWNMVAHKYSYAFYTSESCHFSAKLKQNLLSTQPTSVNMNMYSDTSANKDNSFRNHIR